MMHTELQTLAWLARGMQKDKMPELCSSPLIEHMEVEVGVDLGRWVWVIALMQAA